MTKFLFSKITNGMIFTAFRLQDGIEVYSASNDSEENEILYRVTDDGFLFRNNIQIGHFVPVHDGWAFYSDTSDKELVNVSSGQNDYQKSVEFFMRNHFIPRIVSKRSKKQPVYY